MMTRGFNLKWFLYLWSLCLFPDLLSAQPKPNVIIIMTDDQGYGDFGISGNNIIETPAINKFAHQSVRFERFYVSPVCAPTRASLLTGRYYLRTGVSGVTRRAETMQTEEVTVAELLKANGYVTGCFGKWHNGANYPFDPIGQGFDEFWGFTGGIIRNYFNTRILHNHETVEMEGYLTDFFTDQAIRFIEHNKQRPFFVYLPYNVPHTPIQAPESLFKKYLDKGLDEYTAGIYAMCETVDHNLDKLLKKLQETGLAENTIIMFLTDNGPNGDRYNGGMKGWKGSVDEGGTRVPLWVKWGDRFVPNTVVTQLADHIDILPTVMDLCGLPIPDSLQLDGRSLKPLLLDPQSEWQERNLFTYYNGKGAVRNERYRLTVSKNNELALYDIWEDPSQMNDLNDNLPEIRNTLYRQYQQWLQEVQNDAGIPPVHLGHPEQAEVLLPTASGNLSEGLQYKNVHGYAYDWMTGWDDPKDKVRWEVEVVNEGIYEFFLQYSTLPGSEGAEITIGIGDRKIARKIKAPFVPEPYPNRDLVDRNRPPEYNWKDFSWGRIKLKKGVYQLVVSANRIPENEVGELYAVKVKKVE